MSFLKISYRIRKSTPRAGHEITLPPPWMINHLDLYEVDVLYDSRVIIVAPPDIKVNEKLLDAAFEVKH